MHFGALQRITAAPFQILNHSSVLMISLYHPMCYDICNLKRLKLIGGEPVVVPSVLVFQVAIFLQMCPPNSVNAICDRLLLALRI